MATVDKGLEKAGIKSRTDEYRRVCPGSVFEILSKLDKAMLKFDEILGSSGLSEFSSLGYSSQSSNLSLLETGLDVLGEVPGLIVDEMTEADTNFKSGIEDALSMLQAVFISEISLGTDATMEIDEKAAALSESIEQKERTLNLHNGGLLKAAREEYQAEVEILRKQEAALKQYEMQAKGGNPSALEQSRHARKEIEEQIGKLAEKLMKYADLGFELSDLDEDISKEVLKAIDDRLTEYTSERVTGSLCDYVYRNCEGATSEERIRNGLSAVTETQGCGDLNYTLDYLKHIRGCEIESVESQRTVYSEGVTNQFAFHFMIEDDLYMHEMPKWWMKKKLRIPATVQITEENVEDVYCNDKLRDYYFDSYAVVDMISGMSTKATSSEGDIMDAWWVQERMLSEQGICEEEIYEEWADLNYGAMYDAVNKNGTVRGVKYAMSNWFDIGDHTTQEGRYVVYDNTQTSEYELAVEGYLGKYKHSEDYYNKIWGKDVKINRENQLMVYLTKDREEEKKEELTEAERTLLKEVRETNYYEGFGVCEYMDMNLLAKFMDEEMNADGLSKSARVEGNTIYIECTVYDEFGQETKKSYTMDFSDCRDVFGSRYVSIDECTRMLYDFATVRYEEGWYTDIVVDDCLYSTIAKEQAEAYAREEIRHGVDEQQAREDYQQMVKELMITEDTTRM